MSTESENRFEAVAREIVKAIADVSHWEMMTSLGRGQPPAEHKAAFQKSADSLRELIVRALSEAAER